jgi:hypothetical protein
VRLRTSFDLVGSFEMLEGHVSRVVAEMSRISEVNKPEVWKIWVNRHQRLKKFFN